MVAFQQMHDDTLCTENGVQGLDEKCMRWEVFDAMMV